MFKNKYVISIITFYIIWIGVLPLILNEGVKAVCKNLSFNSGYNITLENSAIRLSVLPDMKIIAGKILIESKTDNTKFEVRNAKVKIRLLPLLSGKIHLNKIKADNIYLTSYLKENLELDKDFFNKLENTRIKCNSINIANFELQLYQKGINTPITYSGKDFSLNLKNRYVSLKTDSELKVDNKVSKANINLFLPKNNDIRKTIFDIEMSNFDISPFRIYFKHYLPSQLVDLKGFINISANKDELITELTDCSAIMKNPDESIIFPKKLSIKSNFNIKKRFITLNSVNIDSDNIHMALDGKIYDYFGKTMPTLDLNIQINKSKVEDFINLMPAFKVEEIDVFKLKKYKFYGDILANFTVKGRLPEPDLNGDIFVNNGILIKPIPNTKTGATIKLELNGKNVAYDVNVPAGNSEKVWVKGTQELYNIKYADMVIKSTQSVDLHTAEVVVVPLHEILNFIIGPVPILDITGLGNIDITVKGNRKTPHVWGNLNFKGANVNFKEIPDLKLTNTDAVLTFNDTDANFKQNKGLVNGKEFNINGNCNLAGKFDFDVSSQNQPTEGLYNAIQTATLIKDIQKIIPKLDKISGTTDLNLKIYGNVKYIEDLAFNKNTFAKGTIALKENDFVFQNIAVNKTNGVLKIDGVNAEADISADINNSPMSIKGKIKNEIGDIVVKIPKLNPNFIIEDKRTREKQYLPLISIDSKYKGKIDTIEYDKLNVEAEILGSAPNSSLKFTSGKINLNDNKLNIKNLKGYLNNTQNSFSSDLRIENAYSKSPVINGFIRLKTPDLTLINEILTGDLLPKNISKYTKDYEFKKGALDLNCKFFNSKISLYTDLSGISFVYLPLELPINIINGTLSARNNTIKLNKINILADKMPILADGEVKDIFDKQNFNLYFNSKPQQEFIDKYINKNQLYPIKIKGDIVYWLRLKGTPDNFDLRSHVNMNKDSSIYHLGATVGDIENSIAIYVDSHLSSKRNLKIKEFSYDKVINSQNGKQTKLNLLKANGNIDIYKDDLGFKDFRIKTTNPTDARIFNIIFRKPNIKQGQFTSDLRFNGKLSNPKVVGDFHIFETNIPFLDTTMKNIAFVFKDRNIDVTSKGEIMGNDLAFEGTLLNKLTPPYKIEKASLYTKDLDLNYIVNKLKTSQVDNASNYDSLEGLPLSSILFNNLHLKADKIHLRNIEATDFEAIANLNEKGFLNINNFIFNIAQGTLEGKYNYNFKNNDMSLNLVAQSISANDITWALFDLNNQIYGDMTGTVNLSCNGSNFENCMQTLSGNTIFNVKNGRMPKLGSLEYLLKAGNLVKGGVTGISINSVIDLITPLKTGEFSDIFGSIRIKDGIARNIEITTKGNDLSLFIGGTYNFANSNAEMVVLGMLSRKISTVLGPIGNMSINTLFNVIPGVDLSSDSLVLERINKIPGIELSSKSFRRFIANIKGNINGENYVTSFQWIN